LEHPHQKGKVARRRLLDSFRSVARLAVKDEDGAELALHELAEQARAAWPELTIDVAAFVRYLADRWEPARDPVAALREVRGPDLALAQVCVRGDATALHLLDRKYLSQTPRYLAALTLRVRDIDEVRQRLRERLLLGRPGEPPRISLYRGRGALSAWIRTAAVRIVVDLERSRAPDSQADEGELERLATFDDPEIAYARGLYGRELKEAFQAALAQLPPRDASLLKLHFIEGMPASEVGRIYGVDGRTVQRWIASSRTQILTGTRANLKSKLGLNSSQLRSVLALARSDFGASVRRLLSPRQVPTKKS
jgi:RNA polymerase sigma-70 factor (ECF subfamily)